MAIHVSASALSDYISCETKLYYRIEKPVPPVVTKEMMMGTISHKVLEKQWLDINKATALAKELCKKEEFDYASEHSVIHFVNTFFDSFQGYITKDDMIEHRFKVKLYDDVYLVGVFDRISNGNVFDWKTSANPPKRLDNNVQFIIYDLAYSMLFGKKPVGLYLAALKNGELIKYQENKLYSTELIERIIPDYVSKIRKGDYLKTGIFNGACYRCPFKEDCLKDE